VPSIRGGHRPRWYELKVGKPFWASKNRSAEALLYAADGRKSTPLGIARDSARHR